MKFSRSISLEKLLKSAACVLLLAMFIWAWPSSLRAVMTFPQGAGKSLQRLKSYRNDPLQIVDIKAANKTVRLGEQFDGGEEWLKSAALTVRNVSGKDIIFIEIDINFPETKSSGNEMSFPLRLGQRPGALNNSAPLLLQTNHEVTLSVTGMSYAELVRFIEHRHPISAINKAIIRVGFVIFADGTGWSGGTFYRQDPNNPNRYVPEGGSENSRTDRKGAMS